MLHVLVFTPYGVNVKLGCGLGVKQIRGRRYLYFWSYEARSWGCRRLWTYVGPVGEPRTRRKAREPLLAYHIRVRHEVNRRIEHLEQKYATAA